MTTPGTSIRAQFQPDVEEFISDMRMFATGSYLNDEDKELWDEPFDPAVLPELKSILETFLDALDLLGDDPDGSQLVSVVRPLYANQHADAVLEPEEKSEIMALVFRAAAASGATDEALQELPEFE